MFLRFVLFTDDRVAYECSWMFLLSLSTTQTPGRVGAENEADAVCVVEITGTMAYQKS